LRHSIDFYCAEGSPIYASRDGVVVWLRDNSNEGGNSKEYVNKGNRIVLKHEKGEYSAYEHNLYESAKVTLGQKVKAGTIIALIGNTGWSEAPHLHFEVFTNPCSDESEGDTLQVVFKNIPKQTKCRPICY
jgi:murein DD-endopeptidase MepM/ murein hydrolase activator NlpD